MQASHSEDPRPKLWGPYPDGKVYQSCTVDKATYCSAATEQVSILVNASKQFQGPTRWKKDLAELSYRQERLPYSGRGMGRCYLLNGTADPAD